MGDFFRSDIREGKAGLPVTLNMTIVNVNNACAPVAGAVVDIWQCDATGNYSQYGSERSETYLRGMQTTDASGRVTFTTIDPGWYQGRATHPRRGHGERRDNVFSDGVSEELVALVGDTTNGYTGTFSGPCFVVGRERGARPRARTDPTAAANLSTISVRHNWPHEESSLRLAGHHVQHFRDRRRRSRRR